MIYEITVILADFGQKEVGRIRPLWCFLQIKHDLVIFGAFFKFILLFSSA